MSSQYDLPPNPREAKYRRPPVHWSGYPVTVLLLVISILVAAVSRIGEDQSRIGFLFAADPMTKDELAEAMTKELMTEGSDALESVKMMTEVAEDPLKHWQDLRARVEKRHSFEQIKEGQVWRLFTPMFIHFGVPHIVFNLMFLWDLGRVLESRFRPLRYLLLVLATSLVANLAQLLTSGPGFGGMSGVLYGLFGFVLIRQKFHPAADVRLNPQTVPWMLIWLVVCFTGAVGHVANAAHVGGLVSGGILGFINSIMGGGWGAMKRRRDFQRAVSRSDTALHRCATCQKTEREDPNMDFRVGDDGEEYCMDHLPRGPQTP